MTTTQRLGDGVLRSSKGDVFDLDAAETPRAKSRLPEIATGILLVVGFGLAALWWQTSSTSTRPAIALGVPIERGQVIELGDLQLVQLASDDPIRVLGESDSGMVVGRVALTDMASGTLLTSDHVSEAPAISPGFAVVGTALQAGDYPSLALRVGDVVDVVLTPSTTEQDAFGADRDGALAAAAESVLVQGVEVVEVATLGNQSGLFVALAMSETEAAMVARADAEDRVRLVQVSGEADQ